MRHLVSIVVAIVALGASVVFSFVLASFLADWKEL